VSLVAPREIPLVFDLGTGLRYFGRTQPLDGTFRGACLLSHLHWDHTQGLPFFVPVLKPGSQFDIFGPVQEDGSSVETAMSEFMSPPQFPVALGDLPGTIRFHDVGNAQFDIGGLHVTSRLIPHVGSTLGFRVEWSGVSVAYLSDHQQPYDGSFSVSPGAMELVDGVDLLIHDAQYTPPEFALKRNWGHCTVEYATWLAVEAGVKRLALFHHDPSRHDAAIDDLLECARKYAALKHVDVIASSDGLVVELPAAAR
jgi:phosphoribosyl 1,2-cyclic phosphodiesterase